MNRRDTIRLAMLPTPFEQMPRLSLALGRDRQIPSIWIKRDDCTGFAGGGNKARKLEYLVADALNHGADVLVTVGAIQSNHARQTAAAAARNGLGCVLLLIDAVRSRGEAYRINGNVLLDQIFGAELRILAPEEDSIAVIAATLARLAGQGGARISSRLVARTPLAASPILARSPSWLCRHRLKAAVSTISFCRRGAAAPMPAFWQASRRRGCPAACMASASRAQRSKRARSSPAWFRRFLLLKAVNAKPWLP